MRLIAILCLLLSVSLWGQTKTTPVSTSTDIFIMPGSDFDRPGLGTRLNFNTGIGHTFSTLTKYKIGDEPTFSYTYENGGGHGFFHTRYGSHTEALGLMKNFTLSSRFGAYLWAQGGLTSLTGYPKIKNRGYDGESAGFVIHFTPHQSIWIQESYNKVWTVPWYTSTGVGYTLSW